MRYKKLLAISGKKINNSVRKPAKVMNKQFIEKNISGPNMYMKRKYLSTLIKKFFNAISFFGL